MYLFYFKIVVSESVFTIQGFFNRENAWPAWYCTIYIVYIFYSVSSNVFIVLSGTSAITNRLLSLQASYIEAKGFDVAACCREESGVLVRGCQAGNQSYIVILIRSSGELKS